MTGQIELRAVRDPDDATLTGLQRVFDHAPSYARAISGAAPRGDEAHQMLRERPPHLPPQAKLVFGVYREGALVGCLDALRGYPDPETAFVGLLLIREEQQGLGTGRAAFAGFEALARTWDECRRLRLAVAAPNAAAIGFWERVGFVQTGERRPFDDGQVAFECVMMDKWLGRPAAP